MIRIDRGATESGFRDDHHRPRRSISSPSLDSTRNYLIGHIGPIEKIENTGWRRLFGSSYRQVIHLQDSAGDPRQRLTITGSEETVRGIATDVLDIASKESGARAIRLNGENHYMIEIAAGLLEEDARAMRQSLKKRNIQLPD